MFKRFLNFLFGSKEQTQETPKVNTIHDEIESTLQKREQILSEIAEKHGYDQPNEMYGTDQGPAVVLSGTETPAEKPKRGRKPKTESAEAPKRAPRKPKTETADKPKRAPKSSTTPTEEKPKRAKRNLNTTK